MFTVGPLVFHLYGVLIGLGILVGAMVAAKKAKLVGLKEDDIWNSLLWMMGLGIVGARLYHVIDLWSYYSQNLIEILAIWGGGLGIFGGILGGVVGLWIYSKKRKGRFLQLLDIVVLGLPLGQAIGRWGNYFNQELYGLPTDLPWGIYIRPENRLLEVINFKKFHPLFLYESLWSLFVFGLLLWLVDQRKVKLGKGSLFISYLGLYGLGRFFLEFLRIESWMVFGVRVAQIVSLGLVTIAIYRFKKLDRRSRERDNA